MSSRITMDELVAREQIRELLHRCSELVDAGDFADAASLFADATLTAAGTDIRVRGVEEVEAAQRAAIRTHDGALRTKHLTTNTIIEFAADGARATARSCFVVLQAVPGQVPLTPILAGRYEDAFERVDGRWRFASRHTVPDLVGDVSHHLNTTLEA